jgi:hypothetical protein
MQQSTEDNPPPLPQISLRGLLLVNTVIGVFVSFLTTLGMGEVSLSLLLIWGVLAVLFLIQWGILRLAMQFSRSPKESSGEQYDPRNTFPPLPREGRGERL